MFKTISICTALVVLGTGVVNAQQQQATLQSVGLPGTGLDIIVATPKSPATTLDLAMSPDALVINLFDGKLALALNSENEMLNAWDVLRRPGCAFQSQGKDGTVQPISVYVVPNYTVPATIRTASLVAPQSEPIMRKVVSITRSLGSGVRAERIDVTAVLMPVYKMPQTMYVQAEYRTLAVVPRFGVRKVSTPNVAYGAASQRNQGRLFPQRLCVLSRIIPQTGASMPSMHRATRRMVPAMPTEMPATSV